MRIDHPLGYLDLPPKLPDERLEELVSRLRKGEATEDDVEELVRGHLRLGFAIAQEYSSNAGSRAQQVGEELVNEAALALVVALSRAAETLKDDKLTPYCISYMRGFIQTSLYKSSMVPIPYSTLRRNERLGGFSYTSDLSGLSDGSSKLDDLKETIELSIRTEFEREVIARRALGFNDREVAAQLKVSRDVVNDAKLSVWERFQKLQNEE